MILEYIGVFILGLSIGSFLNVVIYRMPMEKSIIYPPSSCPNCGYRLKWYDNIPIISYLILKGRCRNCGVEISIIYPLVELLTGILFVFAFAKWGLTIDFAFYAYFIASMIAIAFIDLKHFIIPDKINFAGILMGFIFAYLRQDFTVLDALIGGLVGSLFLFAIYFLYLKVRGIEGLGMGDVKMLAFVGTFTGYFGSLFVIFVGSLLGAIIGILLLKIQGEKDLTKTVLPFGPFLAIASIIYIFFGEYIKSWFLGGM